MGGNQQPHWIGAELDTNDAYNWTDESEWTFQKGELTTEFSMSSLDCVAAKANAAWENVRCSESLPFVCKI
jgi:hypothetical protein